MVIALGGAAVGSVIDQIAIENDSPTRRQDMWQGTIPCPPGRFTGPRIQLFARGTGTGMDEQIEVEPFGASHPDGSHRFLRAAFPVVLDGRENKLVEVISGTAGFSPGFIFRPNVVVGMGQLILSLEVNGTEHRIEGWGTQRAGPREILLFKKGRLVLDPENPVSQFWYYAWILTGSDMDHARLRLWYGNSWVQTNVTDPGQLSPFPEQRFDCTSPIFLRIGNQALVDAEMRDAQLKQVARDIDANGNHRFTLLDPARNDGRFQHGASQALEFSLMFPVGITDPLRVDTFQAEHEGETVGDAMGWEASGQASLYEGAVPPVPIGYASQQLAWEDANRIANQTRNYPNVGQPWDRVPQAHGLNYRPADTATQRDFGRTFMHPELKTRSRRRLLSMLRDARNEATRPVWYREWDTLDYPVPHPYGTRHPDCYFWGFEPSYHGPTNHCVDLFGKRTGMYDQDGVAFARSSNGQRNEPWDREHYGVNHLGWAAIHTANEMLLAMCADLAQGWILGHPVRPLGQGGAAPNMGPPRDTERGFQMAGTLYLATGSPTLLDRGNYWVDNVALSWDGNQPGTLKHLASGEDRELFHLHDPPWFINWWQEGMAVSGLVGWYNISGKAEALSIAKQISRSVCLYGVQDRRTTFQAAKAGNGVNNGGIDRSNPALRPQVGDQYEQRDGQNVVQFTGTFVGLVDAAWWDTGGIWYFKNCTGQVQPQLNLHNLTRSIPDQRALYKADDWQMGKSQWYNNHEPLTQQQMEEWLPEAGNPFNPQAPRFRYVQWGDGTAYILWGCGAFLLGQRWAREANDPAWIARADLLAAYARTWADPTWGTLPNGDNPWMYLAQRRDP